MVLRIDEINVERFESYIDTSIGHAPCWDWKGGFSGNGYAQFQVGKRPYHASRVAYTIYRGPIPAGMTLDHVICQNKRCVNPWHLEPVTRGENVKRAHQGVRQTHCHRGHEMTPENTYVFRSHHFCRQCHSIQSRAYAQRQREKKGQPA